MGNTVTKVFSSPHCLRYKVVGDGTVGSTIANATILADMDAGELKDLWNATYANQAAMRVALLEGIATMRMFTRTAVAVTTAEVQGPACDVDTDAVSNTKAEINLQISDTTGTEHYLELRYEHSQTR